MKRKRQLYHRSVMLLVALFISGYAWAQSIRGKVVSAVTGEAISGASVHVIGQQRSTQTDGEGNFALPTAVPTRLAVSYVGYKTANVDVTGYDNLRIELSQEHADLEEVVVIGYGAQKKKLTTGANLRVEGADLEKRNQISPLQALQGQAPGVSISSTSGQPGADMKVVVRGLGTIGNSGPLYVIDGIPGGDITILNPADIVSIDVLKDAASAAIYGSQAANGVVLVTTKMGTAGRSQLAIDAFSGIQNVGRITPMLNAEQYKIIMNEQALNAGASLIDFDSMEGLADTDWLRQMFWDNAQMQNYNLGLTGGSENSVYAMSLNYINQEGIGGGKNVSNYERYGFRINSEHKFLDKIVTIGQHLN